MPRGAHNHQAVRRRQPHDVTLEDIRLTVARDVFPSDVGYTTRNMGRMLDHYQAQAARNMGCGSGCLALAMRRHGIPTVWAADIHSLAAACCRHNLEQNPELKPITVVQSDLFENVDAPRPFDLILFHQPYFPSTEAEWIAGTPDGGAAVIQRFLTQARGRLSPGGAILMAFQDTAGPENDPRSVAHQMGGGRAGYFPRDGTRDQSVHLRVEVFARVRGMADQGAAA